MKLKLLLLTLLGGCGSLHLGGLEVAPTGGAGFAGLRTYELLQQPAFAVPASCTKALCSPVALADSVDLVPNHHYEWRPAVSTGVAFQHYATTGTKLGGGLGLNMVLLPDGAGHTAPWPSVSAHLGTHEAGFFLGLIISPTDAIQLPGNADVIRVQRDHVPDLILKNRGRAGHFFLGIRLGGPTASLPDSTKQ